MLSVEGLYKYRQLERNYADLAKTFQAEQETYDRNVERWVKQLRDMKEQLDNCVRENRILKRANQRLKEQSKELERKCKMRWVYTHDLGWVPSDVPLEEIAGRISFPLAAIADDGEEKIVIPAAGGK